MTAGRAMPINPGKVGLWVGLIAIAVLATTGWWRVPAGLAGRVVARFTGAGKVTRGGLVVVRLSGSPSTIRLQQALLLGPERAAVDRAVRQARLAWPDDGRTPALNLIQPGLAARGGSAFAASRPAPGDGPPVAAANLDSAALSVGGGPAPVVYLVSETGKIPYAGVGFPGLEHLQVGVNRAGVAAIHVPADRDPIGDPPSTAIAAILAEARTVEEATAVLREVAHLAPAEVILADSTGQAVVVDLVGGEARVRQASSGLALAAGVPPAREWARAPAGSSALSRLQRLTELTALGYGSLDRGRAVAILRDRFDTDARRNDPCGDVIASEATIISAVIEPGAPRLWVAGRAPGSTSASVAVPASFGAFIPFEPPGGRASRAPQASRPGPPAPIPAAPAPADTYAKGQAAFDEAQAARRDLIGGRYAAAIAHYQRALAIAETAPQPKPATFDPANVAPPGLGRLRLRLADARRLQAAPSAEAYREALAAGLSRDDRAYARAALGVILELSGAVKEAAVEYQAALAERTGLEAVEGPVRRGLARLGQ